MGLLVTRYQGLLLTLSSVYAVVAMFSGPVINLLGPRNAAAIGSLSYVCGPVAVPSKRG